MECAACCRGLQLNIVGPELGGLPTVSSGVVIEQHPRRNRHAPVGVHVVFGRAGLAANQVSHHPLLEYVEEIIARSLSGQGSRHGFGARLWSQDNASYGFLAAIVGTQVVEEKEG